MFFITMCSNMPLTVSVFDLDGAISSLREAMLPHMFLQNHLAKREKN